MRSTLVMTFVLGSALVSGSAVNAEPAAGSSTTVPSEPIADLQPRRPAVFSALSGGTNRATANVDIRCRAAEAG